METEIEFLNDLNALLSQALEGEIEPAHALRTAANEVRERLDAIDPG